MHECVCHRAAHPYTPSDHTTEVNHVDRAYQLLKIFGHIRFAHSPCSLIAQPMHSCSGLIVLIQPITCAHRRDLSNGYLDDADKPAQQEFQDIKVLRDIDPFPEGYTHTEFIRCRL